MPQWIPSDHSLTKLDVFDVLSHQLDVSDGGDRQDRGRCQALHPGHDRVDLPCDSSAESAVKTQVDLSPWISRMRRYCRNPARRLNIGLSSGIRQSEVPRTHHRCRTLIILNVPLSRFFYTPQKRNPLSRQISPICELALSRRGHSTLLVK